MLTLSEPLPSPIRPLDTLTFQSEKPGTLVIYDAIGREYHRGDIQKSAKVKVAGSLGSQVAELLDEEERQLSRLVFQVECKTKINDRRGRFKQLLEWLHWTMIGWHGETGQVRYNGKVYRFFVRWLRDHVHTLKGMKYFSQELKTGIELYADSQREDGMIWDNIYQRESHHPNQWQNRFAYGDFIRLFENGMFEFKRIPVENDVEYLFLEGLYFTWKATGDDAWMSRHLDHAIKAVEYSTTDPYRWSKKFKLLKRGYTIDTWDFQSTYDVERSGDPMVVKLGKSEFGVMFGDNTGMVAGLRYLAEMLSTAGRGTEAAKYRRLARKMQERLDEIAWNGQFFTHHIPENPKVKRDFGIDPNTQVTLSNAYSLNRGISHDQAVGIIKTYQRIREEMPKSSPGEWYQVYPIYEKGFGGHGGKWEYMNGGVTTIVAGELAHGAFEHGFEDYGADILERLHALGKEMNGYLHCTYRGAMPDKPKRKFKALDLTDLANADIHGKGAKNVAGWTGEGDNDLRNMPVGRQKYEDVPFKVIDPKENGRKAVLGLSTAKGYAQSATIKVGKTAESLYFLHTMGSGQTAGTLRLRYADGTEQVTLMQSGKALANWWTPENKPRRNGPPYRVAWRGPNAHSLSVGCYVYGHANPHPEKEVSEIVLEAAPDGAKWMVLGITLCLDHPVFFMPTAESWGIPDNWGAGAVTYALIEGLAGIVDAGVNFDKARIAPRWSAAGVDKVTASAHYPAGDGYVRYDYQWNRKKHRLNLEFAAHADTVELELLLPEGREATGLLVDGEMSEFIIKQIEQSIYLCMTVQGLGAHSVEVKLLEDF